MGEWVSESEHAVIQWLAAEARRKKLPVVAVFLGGRALLVSSSGLNC